MHTQRTTEHAVSDILLSHIRQNATLPMAWSIDEASDRGSWTLVFEFPHGEGWEEIPLHANTPWLGVINTIETVEANYRLRANQKVSLPSTHREAAV